MIRSIGDILKKARDRKKITLEKVTKDIKIHPNYIKALEADDYSLFSSKVHSKGFLKIYSEYLGMNVDEILALWRREYEHDFDLREKKQLLPKKFIEPSRFVITPAYIASITTTLLIICFFGYLYFQYRNFTGSPKLNVYYPPDNLVIRTDILDITGKTDLDSEVFVNNTKVILGPDGSFAESVRLKQGLNSLSIKATNKFDKSTEVVKTIIYRPEEAYPIDVNESSQSTLSSVSAPGIKLP
jgi:transcriptional regulator with XRE-family HTH domain